MNGFKQTPTNAREGLANLTYSYVKQKPDIAWVQDDLVAGADFDVPVRIYHPKPEQPLPVLLHFHGGGHMAGSISVYDPICRKIALATNHVVVSSDYRLAPECPYPAGINDALSVTKNIYTTLQQRKVKFTQHLAIVGDSAGGAISATVSHMMQHNSDVKIEKMILIYPSLDYTLQAPSLTLNGEGYVLETEKIYWYVDNYFQNREDRKKVSPLYMDFSSNLPETLMITAEFCPIRDDGYNYAKKLKDARVPCKHLHFEDMIHAFMNMEDLVKSECDQIYHEMAIFLENE